MRVLLAENRVSLQIVYKLLAKNWFVDLDLDIVSNGLEVLEQVGRERYDLCIMDLRMPFLISGEEAARGRCQPPLSL